MANFNLMIEWTALATSILKRLQSDMNEMAITFDARYKRGEHLTSGILVSGDEIKIPLILSDEAMKDMPEGAEFIELQIVHMSSCDYADGHKFKTITRLIAWGRDEDMSIVGEATVVDKLEACDDFLTLVAAGNFKTLKSKYTIKRWGA